MVDRIGLHLSEDTHDVELAANGALLMVTDAEAVGEHAHQRVKTFHKEWFLDNECGVQWLEQVLGFKPDLALAESLTKAEIFETDGVTGITEYGSQFNRRIREIEVTRLVVETEYD